MLDTAKVRVCSVVNTEVASSPGFRNRRARIDETVLVRTQGRCEARHAPLPGSCRRLSNRKEFGVEVEEAPWGYDIEIRGPDANRLRIGTPKDGSL